jgi:hypothetical protein
MSGTIAIRIAAKIHFIAGLWKIIVSPPEVLVWSAGELRMARRPGGSVTSLKISQRTGKKLATVA